MIALMIRSCIPIDLLARQEAYQYDFKGTLTQFNDRKGEFSRSTYDPLNRWTRSSFADGTFTEFTFDAADAG